MKIFTIKRTQFFRLYVSIKTEIKSTYTPPQMRIVKGGKGIPFQVA